MADFNKGDRIVKMSGVNAGKYGTINSISESGTLNVTFDGERLPRFCDPERCGKIGLNATYAVGDRVKFNVIRGFTPVPKTGTIRAIDKYGPNGDKSVADWFYIDVDGGGKAAVQAGNIVGRNAACNAKFKVGDRVWFKAPVTGARVTAKITATLGGEKYGFVDDDGIQGTIEGNAIYPLNSSAANATFKKGDRVIWKGRFGTVRGVVEGPTLAPGSYYIKLTDDVRITPTQRLVDHAAPASELTLANARARNRASVYEYGVGDTVKLRSGRTGEVLAKYVDKNGDIKIDVDLNGTRFTASPDMVDSVVKNARARNATGDQVIATSGKYKLVYNPLNEGYWFYVGDYGEGMSDANGRPIFGKDKNSVAMAEFKRLVATANSRAANATYKLSSREAKVGDLVRVSGMLGTYKVTKINGNELEIVDAEDETYRDRVEARFATPIKNACRNASIDDEFPKLKAMGKANAEQYLKDHAQELIDKYGHPEVVKLAKKIQSIRLKPIKKGRFAGKSGDMTYYVDYTADSMHASRYGKDGTNVTEIQVTGPYVMDPDGKERRHILYYYRSGTESIPAQSSEVRSLVSSIMRGPDVVKQGDPAFAWNACGEDK